MVGGQILLASSEQQPGDRKSEAECNQPAYQWVPLDFLRKPLGDFFASDACCVEPVPKFRPFAMAIIAVGGPLLWVLPVNRGLVDLPCREFLQAVRQGVGFKT